ncbi:DUF418 domain-containing protein [Segetibacter sp. 3557_3]|uniref:DUF418 domain-containing protein n=1 Tax=Segetibacter sp. 3557_3 TaxID=2547429 RepID=UPI0010587F19|nr:DUF418 domain-containing protein [Segetibacter sp. 3557_3]TDH20680.1 DUF418 domain-containing protein [Segetibacter sp. 3557_3]
MELPTAIETNTIATVATPATVTTKPVDSADRLQTVDMIRGVALLGILMMNIPGFGIHWSVYDPILKGSPRNADYITLEVVETFFSGTMRGLFSMLFGAGMILFTLNKKEAPGGVTVAEYYYRRLLWLVLFGVFNAYVLLWIGDILFFYGLCGMLLFPFRKLDPKWLVLIGLLCMGIGMLKGVLSYQEFRAPRMAYVEAIAAEKANKKLTEKQKEAKAEWLRIEERRKPDTSRIGTDLRTMDSGYPTIFSDFIPRNSGSETWGMYHGLWDMLMMMFIGMGLFMWGFFSNRLSTSNYTMTLLIGYGLGIPISYIMFSKGWVGSRNLGPYLDRYSMTHEILYDLRRLLLCLGHASLLLLIYRSKVVPWLMKALSNVGQMAFTNYLMQSIICTLFFYGYGLSKYNELRYYQLYYVVIAVWIFQIIYSAIWLRYFRFGPFEWLWRSLTYWRLQPMRK